MKDYESFIAGKRRAEVATGHKPGDLNEHLVDKESTPDAMTRRTKLMQSAI